MLACMDRDNVLTRRRALTLLTGAGATAVLVACGSSDKKATAASTSSSSSTASSSTAAASGSSATAAATATEEIPEETGGPFPADGTNGPNVLTQDGVVRRDITSSFGSMSGTAEGVPTTVELTITDLAKGAAYAGAAVYLWHNDRDGNYSLYSRGVTDQNYLRGVQEADANGKVTFETIYPGAYQPRWPHIHFEVYPSLAEATKAGNPIATSQLALPEDISNEVYKTDGYEASVALMSRNSLDTDMVFRDGAELETPTAEGDADNGVTLRLAVGV